MKWVCAAHLDSLCGDLGLAHAHVALAEEELPVQIADLNGVHVHLHARWAKVHVEGEFFYTQTSTTPISVPTSSLGHMKACSTLLVK